MAQLANSPAEIVQWLLVDLGIGTSPLAQPLADWATYDGNEPSKPGGSPDNVLTVYDTVGTDSGRAMFDGAYMRHYGIQIRIRAADKPTGWRKAEQIRVALESGVYDRIVTIPGEAGVGTGTGTGTEQYEIACFARVGASIPLGTDSPKTKRQLFTVNATVAVRPVGGDW